MHDFHVIAVDETDMYTIDVADKPYIKRILGVYMYDNNRHVHICSLTPVLELRHLYNNIELHEDMDISDDVRERLYEDFSLLADEPYTYMNVTRIENKRKLFPDMHHSHGVHNDIPDIADYDNEDEWYAALEDKVHEYLSCNHKL